MNRQRDGAERAAAIAANKGALVEGMFDQIAGRYDLINDLMTFGMHRVWKRATLAALGGRRHGNVLDVATGTGDLALALALGSPTARVVGLDFSAAMLDRAQRRTGAEAQRRQDERTNAQTHEPTAPRPTFVRGDALRLPFDDRAFSAATSSFALRNVADLGQMFRELARVLAPGGRVALLDLVPFPDPPLWTRLAQLHLRYGVPVLGRLVAGEIAAYRYLPASIETIPPLPQIERLLADAGFAAVGHRAFGLGTVALIAGTRR